MKTAPLLSWLGIRGAVIDNQSANPISAAQTHLPYGSGGSFSGAEETGEQGTYIRAAQHIADHASEGIAVGALLLCAAAKQIAQQTAYTGLLRGGLLLCAADQAGKQTGSGRGSAGRLAALRLRLNSLCSSPRKRK